MRRWHRITWSEECRDELQLPSPFQVVVSTTTSGWTTISCDDVHDGGSSVMVVSERSEPRSRRGTYVTDGLLLLLLLPSPPRWTLEEPPVESWRLREQRSMHGDGSGVGVAIRSSLSAGITSAGGPTSESRIGRKKSPLTSPMSTSAEST